LGDVTPRQRSMLPRHDLILGSGTGARDFHTQAVITGNLMTAQGSDDHHVFPADFLLKKKRVTLARTRDCVLNRKLFRSGIRIARQIRGLKHFAVPSVWLHVFRRIVHPRASGPCVDLHFRTFSSFPVDLSHRSAQNWSFKSFPLPECREVCEARNFDSSATTIPPRSESHLASQ
jgi:hypothetical protein